MDQIEIEKWVRPWTLLRADPNIRDAVMVGDAKTTLKLRHSGGSDAAPAFKVAQVNSRAVDEPFTGWELIHNGWQTPNLGTAGLEALPLYKPENQDHEDHYCNALDHHLIPYLTSNPNLERLEGKIKVRCPWPRNAKSAADVHYVDTDVKVYQFKDGIIDDQMGSKTLLVIWAPDSPRLPTNPDGTALGYA